MARNSIERFTEKVQFYLKYRPCYPKEILELLIRECGLNKKKIIADIGSGTGFLAKLFLDFGHIVYGVEPNQAMRKAGESFLVNYSHFHSVSGTSETTHLENESIDFITVGTAFHWFDLEKTKKEFLRIAKPNAWVVLIWNVRDTKSPAICEYESLLLEYGIDYVNSKAEKFDKVTMNTFFENYPVKTALFRNVQLLDWNGFKGRLLSTSFIPGPESINYRLMIKKLKQIFSRYEKNGIIKFLYQTNLFYSHI